jgi:hypothetical protein
MTPEQVLNAEAPGAKKIEQPDQLGDLVGAIAITGIQLGTDTFNAAFFFDSDLGLQTVVLTCLEKNNVEANARTFSYLEDLLTAKHGSPTYRDGVQSRRVFWELPGTTIRLVHFTAFEGRASRVNVSYMPSRLSAR